MSNAENIQRELCTKLGSSFIKSAPDQKLGIALNVKTGLLPINGLRRKPEGDTTGWYIWAGEEFSEAPDFFKPLHVSHLEEWCPQIVKYLGMAPGWRFLVAGEYEDVWFDKNLRHD